MTILQVHNFYQQPGGEDEVFRAEYGLLRGRGHRVPQYVLHNDAIKDMSKISAGVKTIWNARVYREIREIIQCQRPDVLHAHNVFPLISPALYYAASAEHVPVVQTLHNYRLLCPGGNFFRNGQVCEECLSATVPFPAVRHRCYRHSAAATGTVAAMLVTHRLADTWNTKVQNYIALTHFAKSKFVESGLTAARIAVKPNFLTVDPGFGPGEGDYALFAGRLSEEKGICVLLESWERLGSAIPLKIAGNGPLHSWVRERVRDLPGVDYIGHCTREEITRLLKRAKLLVLPSTCYEGLPLILIEAFACGTPVVGSALGSINELIQDGVNGFRFRAGSSDDLAGTVQGCLSDGNQLRDMRRGARCCYERNYTPERNYDLLMEIYAEAIHRAKTAQYS